MVHTDMMKRDHHESIDATNTDVHNDINADVDETASSRESGQNLSDTESEKTQSRRTPVFSKYAMLLEPIMFVYALYMGAVFPLMDQFVRAQISSKYNTSGGHNSTHIPGVCSRNSSRHRNDEVDAEASRWMLYTNAAAYLPGVVSLWMLGPYSDRQGRKVAIIVPQIGTLLRCISALAVIYFDLPLYVMLIGAFIEGASGGIFMVVSAGFSYVADITKHENRSFRITVLDSFFSIGITVSQVATGYLIASVGYFYPFLILTAIILLDLVVAAIFLPETVTKDPLVRFWSLGHFRKAFNLYFRDNGTGRRWKLLLSLVIVFLSCSVTYASFDIQTFYLIDVPFCLSSIQIGYFGAMLSCISAPVSMLMTKFTLSIFGDSGLLLIGAISTTCYEVVMTFSTRRFLIFMGKFHYCDLCLYFLLNYDQCLKSDGDCDFCDCNAH